MTGDQVIARLFFEMTRVIHKTYMPDTRFGTFLDLVPVGYAIFLGQAEGRPMGLTGLARFLDTRRFSKLHGYALPGEIAGKGSVF